MTNLGYKQCSRCLMDTTAEEILFDSNGVCNFCKDFLSRLTNNNNKDSRFSFDSFISGVKRAGSGKRYDCIIGVSGGVDSSWVLVKAVEAGLRPLAVHMDNGWNSELAQNNIHNLITSLNVDLYTYVIDWSEYRGLMQAFFDADVVDVELLYDNAMTEINYRLASQYNVQYILSGQNLATEGIAMPRSWNWFKYDGLNIRAIASKHGAPEICTFPLFSISKYLWYRLFRRIQWTAPLDMLEYNKNNCLNCLEVQYGYKRYPYKHYESIFTRFYQGFILPKKFGIDKRKMHLSTLIMTNQLTRKEADILMESIPYLSEQDLENDKFYFLKKMKWSEEDLFSYLKRASKSHATYSSSAGLWKIMKKFYLFFKQ
jgi:N-acetyl sugar amidotransferase